MSDARETKRYAALLAGQLTAYLVIIGLLDVVRPPSVPFLTLPLVAVVLIHFTAIPWALVRVLGCEVVTEDDHPRLHARVERLARRADIEAPRIAIRDAPSANALATGIAGVNGTIVLHSTLVEQLDDNELDGVLAHEMAHLVHHDAPKTMALATVALHAVGTLPSLIASALHLTGFPRAALTMACIAGAGTTVLAYLRRNEYRADATAARLLGNGAPLADALAKIGTPYTPRTARNIITAARPPSGGLSPSLTALLTTHPRPTHRIQRLLDSTPDDAETE